MGQPVKLSADLVLDARTFGEAMERSIASQIEHWARLGRAAERLLRTEDVVRLKQRGDLKPLSTCLATVESPEGRARLAAHLEAQPFPHFEPGGGAGLLVKIDEDGTRTVGRMVKRTFQPLAKR